MGAKLFRRLQAHSLSYPQGSLGPYISLLSPLPLSLSLQIRNHSRNRQLIVLSLEQLRHRGHVNGSCIQSRVPCLVARRARVGPQTSTETETYPPPPPLPQRHKHHHSQLIRL